MKDTAHTNTAMWLSVGAAVVAAVIFTNSAAPLWFFVIPFFASIHDKSEQE